MRKIYQNEKVISEMYRNKPKILQVILKLNGLYYQLAKDHFVTNKEIEAEADNFLNS